MTLTEIVIFGLATWRISYMLVEETGPFKLFTAIRKLTGIKHDETGKPLMIPDNIFAGIFSCVYCCSVWIAGFWWLFHLYSPSWSVLLSTPPAISALAVVINSLVRQ